jgi:hypothetical protein
VKCVLIQVSSEERMILPFEQNCLEDDCSDTTWFLGENVSFLCRVWGSHSCGYAGLLPVSLNVLYTYLVLWLEALIIFWTCYLFLFLSKRPLVCGISLGHVNG